MATDAVATAAVAAAIRSLTKDWGSLISLKVEGNIVTPDVKEGFIESLWRVTEDISSAVVGSMLLTSRLALGGSDFASCCLFFL